MSVVILLSTGFMWADVSAHAQAVFNGTITEWTGGSPTVSPRAYALLGARIVVGTNLSLETRGAGIDDT